MLLIGITGKARSGKDTVGKILLDYHEFETFAFADTLKQAASIIFNLPITDFYEGDREKVDEFWGISPRQMLQKLGTEACRNGIMDDIWIRRAHLTLADMKLDATANKVAVTDVRFNNEADWIRRQEGKIIHISRDGLDPVGDEGHITEAGVLHKKGDFIVYNNGTPEDLQESIYELMNEQITSSGK